MPYEEAIRIEGHMHAYLPLTYLILHAGAALWNTSPLPSPLLRKTGLSSVLIGLEYLMEVVGIPISGTYM